jgi:hypothetical protein
MERLLGWGMQIFAVLGLWRGLIGALAIAVLGWPAGAAAQAFQTLYSFQGAPDGLSPFGVVVDPTTGNIVQALKDEPITLYGDGRQTRSFCYVDDLLDGLNLLMESPPTSLAHVILATLTRSQFAISPSSCFARSARNRASSTVRSRKMIRSGANR